MSDRFRVLVTGSRTWIDTRTITEALGELHVAHPDLTVVHGACPRGADLIADAWARRHGVLIEPHPADWATYGRSAGHRRNATMVATRPDLVLAFIRDRSPGASGCAALADRAGLHVRRWTA